MTQVGHPWKVISVSKGVGFSCKAKTKQYPSRVPEPLVTPPCSAPRWISIKPSKYLLIFWEPRAFAFLFLSIPHAIQYPLTCLGRNKPKPQPESPVSPHESKTCLYLAWQSILWPYLLFSINNCLFCLCTRVQRHRHM